MKHIFLLNKIVLILFMLEVLTSCSDFYEVKNNQPELNIIVPDEIDPITCELRNNGLSKNIPCQNAFKVIKARCSRFSTYALLEGIYSSTTKIDYNQHGYYLFPLSNYEHSVKKLDYYLGVDSKGNVADKILVKTNPTIFSNKTIFPSAETCIKNVETVSSTLIKNEQERQKKLNQHKIENQKIEMQHVKIGTKICHDEENGLEATFIGFVENRSGDKIQIRVSDCIYSKNRMAHCDAKEKIIWDFYENWRICE